MACYDSQTWQTPRVVTSSLTRNHTLTHSLYTCRNGAHISSFSSPFKNCWLNHELKQASYCSLSCLQGSMVQLMISYLEAQLVCLELRLTRVLARCTLQKLLREPNVKTFVVLVLKFGALVFVAVHPNLKQMLG